MTNTLDEYKEFIAHKRFIAQLARDFMDLGKPGSIEITMGIPSFEEIHRIKVEFYQELCEGEELVTEEMADFSPGFVKERLSLQPKPSVADLEGYE